MKLYFNQMLYAFSYALDCVEADLLGVSTNHSKRVACISMVLGKKLGFDEFELLDLAACSVMHGNALTEYIASEHKVGAEIFIDKSKISIKPHCILGERNMKYVPTFGNITGAVKYHHENADGSGPFGLKENETPVFSKLIHLADQIDTEFKLGSISEEKYNAMVEYVVNNKGTQFSKKYADLFIEEFSKQKIDSYLSDSNIDATIKKITPSIKKEYNTKEIMGFCRVFSNIIDYKSKSTKNHSIGISEKSYKMAEYYDFDNQTTGKLYLAAAFHDIGKLVVDPCILEKPDRLTVYEYEHVKTHVEHTEKILSKIEGIEEIKKWASQHHERLDGSGYPNGIKEEELDFNSRLMACLDIYQALTEERSYKKGFEHDKAINILNEMADKNYVDKNIIKDIDKVFGQSV